LQRVWGGTGAKEIPPLTQTGRHSRRIRRLPAAAVVWLVIAIGIWTDLDIPAIWRQCGLTVGVQQTERRGYNLSLIHISEPTRPY